MMTRTFSLIALCAALAACNSKTPEPTTAATDAVTPAAEAPAVPSAAPAVAMKPEEAGYRRNVDGSYKTSGDGAHNRMFDGTGEDQDPPRIDK